MLSRIERALFTAQWIHRGWRYSTERHWNRLKQVPLWVADRINFLLWVHMPTIGPRGPRYVPREPGRLSGRPLPFQWRRLLWPYLSPEKRK